ncbi:hypothetical protein AAFF_G00259760 [Aldrovandia affinis]|uniref:Uncharacterized protein n=1 Tax=Aldrovandia affinis TaxID=143900 RepID=A0AAD7W2Q0_9TELE|nr:hypothetical protein AAFF_G00259760 [Aldrovandia affinis]
MVKVFTFFIGNTLNADKAFTERLGEASLTKVSLTKVDHVEDCDIILAFCPISSRTGVDVGEALQRIPDYKPAILVMIHHTYDPKYIVPENRNEIRSDVLAVDILFHEKKGLLKCQHNDSAVDTVLGKLNLQQPRKTWKILILIVCLVPWAVIRLVIWAFRKMLKPTPKVPHLI